MSVEGENLGVATIYLTVDKTSMEADIGKAKLQLAGMGAEAQKQYEAMTASQRKMAEGLVKQAELINKTTAERVAYNAQLKIGGALGDEIAAKALANAQATAAAQNEMTASARAAEAAQAELAAAEDARFKQIAADAMAEVEVRQAITAATIEQARANAALTEAQGLGAGVASAGAAGAGALDTAIVQQQIADYAALDAIMGKKVATTEEVAAAEAALDRLQAAGMISNEQLAETFAALDVVTTAETKALQANSAAQLENAAATKLNSRTQYELGVLLGETASGNVSRIKRSIPALLNAMNLTQKIFSPLGLAIGGVTAALAIFGKEVYDREADLLAFNKALAATGDFAGVTGSELQGIAAEIGQSTGRYDDATAAVLALAKSGDVLGSHFREMATIAVNMSYLTGESVDSIAKELIKLQGDPTQAIAKLNSAMGLLTQAQYNQIVETQQQQGAAAAAALAMQDLSDASDTARTNLVDNAGVIIRKWEGFKGVLAEIGRDLGSIGATESAAEQIAEQRARIKTINARGPFDFRGDDATKQKDLADANAKIAQLQFQQQSDAMFAAGEELGNQAKEAHDKALAELLHSNKQGDEGFITQTAEINKKRYEALVGIVDPAVRDKINAAADQQIRDAAKRLDAQYPHNPSTAHHADPAATALATFQSQVAGLTDRSLYVEGDKALTQYVQGVAKLNDEFDKAIAKHADLTKAQAAYDEGMKAINKTLGKNEAAQAAEVKAMQDASDAKIAAYKAQIALQVQSVGMSDKEIQRAQRLAQLQTQYADQLERLQEKAAIHPEQKDAIDAQIANVTRERDAMVQATEDGFAQMDAAQASWSDGFQAGIANFLDRVKDQAQQAKDFVNEVTSGFADAFVEFATGAESAKKAFGSFIDQLFADALRVEANQIIAKLLGAGTHQQTFSTSSLDSGFNIDSGAGGSSGSSDSGWFSSLLSAIFNGGKAGGGPVDAGRLYQVNENGPELLTVGNTDYLMMGKQSGNVTPNADIASTGRRSAAVTVNQTIVVGSLVDHRTREQLALETARRQRIATARNG